MKKNILLFYFVIALFKVESQCVTYYNGVTYDTEFKNAAEYLCNNGIIDNTFNVGHMYDWITRKEMSLLIFKTLYPSSYPLLDNYLPYSFIDLNNLSSFDRNAMLIMLHLEYPDKTNSNETDGIPPLSREFFNTRPNQAINYGFAMRMFLESFNYSIDWTGYDKNNSNFSTVYDDVRYNDPNFGYIRTAKFNNIHVNNTCTGWNFCPNDLITVRNAYVILYRIMNNHPNPRSSPSSYNQFFIPNTITANSISSPVDISRGVFSHYEDQSFNIKGGGFPLEFTHSYFSHYTELPRYDRENVRNGLEFQRFCPLGHGWTHSYNINAQIIESTDMTQQKIYFWWEDGTADIYNYTTKKWESENGRYLSINIISGLGGGTYIDTIWVTKPNHVRYKFAIRDLEATSYSLIEIRDRNDNTLTLNYETGNNLGTLYNAKRLKTVTDNVSGRSLTFYYSPLNNYIAQVSDNSGRFILYTVDQNSNDLVSFTDAENGNYIYTYAQNAYDRHLLKSITKPKGNTIYADYFKRKLKQTQSSNYVTKVDFTADYFSASGTKTIITTNLNGQTLNSGTEHNSLGLPTKILDSSHNILIRYNDINNPTLPTFFHDVNRNISTQIEYDLRGNKTRQYKIGSNSSLVQEEKFEYASMWNVVRKYTDPKGSITEYLVDNINGNVFGIKYPDNTQTTFARNGSGNITQITLPDNKKVELKYNQYGNLSEYGYLNSPNQVKAYYNSISNIDSIVDARKIATQFVFDKNDNLKTKIDDANGLRETTSYNYDKNENLEKITNAENHATILSYDPVNDDLLNENDPIGKNKTWTYNDDGSIKSFKDKQGRVFYHNYSAKGNFDEGKLRDDGYATYQYYSDWKDIAFVNKDGKTIQQHYDPQGRIDWITYSDFPNNKVSYEYDQNNNMTKITYPNGRMFSYSYNNRNRLEEILDLNGPVPNRMIIHYEYYEDGRLKRENKAYSETRYFYDNENRLDSIVHLKDNGATIIAAYKYELDANGNHISETAYEPFASILIKNSPNIDRTCTYDGANRILTSSTASNIQHSGNGTIDVRGTYSYSYDAKDNMTYVSDGTNSQNFQFDGLENRRKKNNAIQVLDIVNNSNVLMYVDGTSLNPSALYVHGLGLVCQYDYTTQKYYYYHYDSRGSTVAITEDVNNTLVNAYQYGTFGEVTAYKNDVPTPFIYVGKYGVQYDDGNLYFMRARMYNPYYGRFMSEDPIFSNNLYPYADNNPINKIDPNGKLPKFVEEPIANYISKHFTLEEIDQLCMIVNFIDEGRYLGTGYVEESYRYYENIYINNYVNGGETFLPMLGMAITSLWLPENFKRVVDAFTLSPEDTKIVTKIIGKKGLLKLMDMRTKNGNKIKLLYQVANLLYDTQEAINNTPKSNGCR